MCLEPRIKLLYQKIIKDFMKEFNYYSPMQVPKLRKIVISKGIGDKQHIDTSIKEISFIAGQRAIPCCSKRDVSNFNLRKGTPIGIKATLRSDKMYEFFDRLITIALPRVRDFHGLKKKSFDGFGNYNLGISEHIIFPEITIDRVNKISGMDITFVTSTKNDFEAFVLLDKLGLPFKKK